MFIVNANRMAAATAAKRKQAHVAMNNSLMGLRDEDGLSVTSLSPYLI